MVQLGPPQDRLRAGHGGPLPGDDTHSGNGTSKSNDPHFLRYGKLKTVKLFHEIITVLLPLHSNIS